MSHLRCPRCGLTVYARHSEIAPQYCPRCIAHARIPVLMETSPAASTDSPNAQPRRSRSLDQPRAGRAGSRSAHTAWRPTT